MSFRSCTAIGSVCLLLVVTANSLTGSSNRLLCMRRLLRATSPTKAVPLSRFQTFASQKWEADGDSESQPQPPTRGRSWARLFAGTEKRPAEAVPLSRLQTFASQKWEADGDSESQPQPPTRGRSWARLFAGTEKRPAEAVPLSRLQTFASQKWEADGDSESQPTPPMRRRFWRRLFAGKKKQPAEGSPFDERKLSRLPYFMRSARSPKDILLKMYDRIYQRLYPRKVIADLYRRHDEDERIFGSSDDDE